MYSQPDGERDVSPLTLTHRVPGPTQLTAPVPREPSPGSNNSRTGVAVVVAQREPVGVGTHAVTLTGDQSAGLIQNHVSTVTTPLVAGGANVARGGGRHASRLRPLRPEWPLCS